MTNELSEITKISDTEMYTASIHFYSKGASDQVTVAMNVSHPLSDDYDDYLPASYMQMREIMLNLRRNAVLYAGSDDDLEFLSDPNISTEEKAERVLQSAADTEASITATKH